jgi:hypothetical protein
MMVLQAKQVYPKPVPDRATVSVHDGKDENHMNI